MDRLKDRYFIRYNTKQQQGVRLHLCSARTLMRVFIHFISDDDFHSLEIYQEDYFNKAVSKMERKNGTLTAGKRQRYAKKCLVLLLLGLNNSPVSSKRVFTTQRKERHTTDRKQSFKSLTKSSSVMRWKCSQSSKTKVHSKQTIAKSQRP